MCERCSVLLLFSVVARGKLSVGWIWWWRQVALLMCCSNWVIFFRRKGSFLNNWLVIHLQKGIMLYCVHRDRRRHKCIKSQCPCIIFQKTKEQFTRKEQACHKQGEKPRCWNFGGETTSGRGQGSQYGW